MMIAVKIMIFAIMFNIAVGLMTHTLPVLEPENRLGLEYNEDDTTNFRANMSADIETSTAIDTTNLIDNVLNRVGLGFITKIKGFFQRYLYGLVYYLDKVFGPWLDSGVYIFLFGDGIGILYILMTIGYVLTTWSLFTGRSLNG